MGYDFFQPAVSTIDLLNNRSAQQSIWSTIDLVKVPPLGLA